MSVPFSRQHTKTSKGSIKARTDQVVAYMCNWKIVVMNSSTAVLPLLLLSVLGVNSVFAYYRKLSDSCQQVSVLCINALTLSFVQATVYVHDACNSCNKVVKTLLQGHDPATTVLPHVWQS